MVGPSPCGYHCEQADVYKSIAEAAWYSVADNGVVYKWKSLVPGSGFVAGFKILQWVYNFDGQLYVKYWMRRLRRNCAVTSRCLGGRCLLRLLG